MSPHRRWIGPLRFIGYGIHRLREAGQILSAFQREWMLSRDWSQFSGGSPALAAVVLLAATVAMGWLGRAEPSPAKLLDAAESAMQTESGVRYAGLFLDAFEQRANESSGAQHARYQEMRRAFQARQSAGRSSR